MQWFFIAGHRFLQSPLVGATPHCGVRGFLIPVAPLAMEHKL